MRKLKLIGKERFLVIRTDRIGDLVLSTPVLAAIKSHFPGSHITMMVSPYAADVIENHPNIDQLIIDDRINQYPGVKGFIRLVKEMRKGKFEVGILLKPTFRLAVLLFLAGVKYRIGTGLRFYQIFFNRKVYMHRKVNLKHEVDYNLDLLGPLGITPGKILPKVYVSPPEEEFARQTWEKFRLTPDDMVVVIHPGSGDSSLNLPAKRFAEAADELARNLNAKIVFTGSEGEKNLIGFIRSHMQHESVDLAGKTTLRQLKAILKKCDVLISNSTGPMHLACALGIPTVAIFCPVFAAGPIRWGPYGEGHQVILPPVPMCFKCKPKNCPHFDCMEKIGADQIVSQVSLVLQEKIRIKRSLRNIGK